VRISIGFIGLVFGKIDLRTQGKDYSISFKTIGVVFENIFFQKPKKPLHDLWSGFLLLTSRKFKHQTAIPFGLVFREVV